MTVDAGALTYQFKADVSDIKAKVAEIQKSLQQAGQQAQQAGKQIAEGMKDGQKAMQDATIAGTTLGTTLGSVLGRGLGAAIKAGFGALQDFAKELKDIEQAAKVTGISLEQMMALRRTTNSANKESGKNFDITSGITEFALKVREAEQSENELYKLAQKSNIAFRDSAGNIRPTLDIFTQVALKIADTKNELDKIKAAELFGFGRDAVPAIERFAEGVRNGNQALSATDRAMLDIVNKAEEFDKAWQAKISQWEASFRNAIQRIKADMNNIFLNPSVATQNWQLGKVEEMLKNPYVTGNQRKFLEENRDRLRGSIPNPITDDAETRRGNAFSSMNRELEFTLKPTRNKGTGFASKDLYDKGGGSSGKSSLDQIERYIAGLEKARDTAQVEVELWGKSNLDREKALKLVEAANAAKRAGRDLTEDEKQKIGEIVTKTVQWKDQLDQLRAVQDAMREFGNTLASGLEQAIINGQKLGDVLKNVVKSLASSALKGFLTGEGPFGKIMGLSGQNGMAGGLFGSLFNGFKMFADGGRPPTGVPSIIGERGPELWMPDSAGTVIPAGKFGMGGGGGGIVMHNDFRGADAGAVVQIKQHLKMLESTLNSRIIGVNRSQQLRGFA